MELKRIKINGNLTIYFVISWNLKNLTVQILECVINNNTFVAVDKFKYSM